MPMSLKQFWNKYKTFQVVSMFYFSFVSHVRVSEMILKQNCFVSVYFTFILYVRMALAI